MRRPWPAAMHGRAVVPHHDIAAAPLVQVARPRGGRCRHQFVNQLLARCRLHALDSVGVRGQIDRPAAVDGIFPHHAPALRRQRRALLGAGEVRRDLAARMRVIMPGKRVLQSVAQGRIEPREGKPGGDVLGLAAARGNDARRQDRCQRRHPLERGVGVPKLIGLRAHRHAVIGRHDLAVGTDGAQDHKMRAGTL